MRNSTYRDALLCSRSPHSWVGFFAARVPIRPFCHCSATLPRVARARPCQTLHTPHHTCKRFPSIHPLSKGVCILTTCPGDPTSPYRVLPRIGQRHLGERPVLFETKPGMAKAQKMKHCTTQILELFTQLVLDVFFAPLERRFCNRGKKADKSPFRYRSGRPGKGTQRHPR